MILTELSGNELVCLAAKNFEPGDIVIGNSTYSLGFNKTIESSLKSVFGKEIRGLTKLLAEGKSLALHRMMEQTVNPLGFIKISFTTSLLPGVIEFCCSGSGLQRNRQDTKLFTTSANGNELYIQIDAGYQPIRFVFGNAAYSTGTTSGLIGGIKNWNFGEKKDFSEYFNQMRRSVLDRIIQQAKTYNANAIIGIKLQTHCFSGVNEMLLTGTASFNTHPENNNEIITSHLSANDLWNLTKLGYAPRSIVLSSIVFSLGTFNKLSTAWKSITSGETELFTKMFAQARQKVFAELREQATILNAEKVIGIKTYLNHLGNGLIEYFVMGTAVNKIPGIRTTSDQLIPQALVSI